MTEKNCCIALFATIAEIKRALQTVEEIGFDTDAITVIGRKSQPDSSINGTLTLLDLTLSDIGIPAENIQKYKSAVYGHQWLLLIHGNAQEVQHAADILATGKEIEVSVHHRCIDCTLNHGMQQQD